MSMKFDRFPIQQGGIPMPHPAGGIPANISYPSIDTAAPTRDLAAQVQHMAGAIQQAVEKRQALIDQTTLSERYMQATSDMDTLFVSIESNADLRANAPDVWQKGLDSASKQWSGGLRPEMAMRLQHELAGRQVEYAHRARQLQNRYYLDKADATVIAAHDRLTNDASRLDITDEKSFEDLLPRADENGNVLPSQFQRMLDGYVQLGHMTQEKAAKVYKDTVQDTAYARALRIVTESPSRYIDAMKREETDKGSTFLNFLDPTKRTELLRTAQDKRLSMVHEAERLQAKARADMERGVIEQTEVMEGRLEQKLRAGELTLPDIEDARELRLVSSEKYAHFRDALTSRAVQGGPGNPAVIRRLGTEIYTTKDPLATRAEILDAGRRGDLPFDVEKQYLGHVEGKAKVFEVTPPTIKEQHSKAVDLYKEALRVTGPMAATINPLAQQVLSEALEELDRNAMNGFPENPLQIYYKKKNEYMSRIGAPAAARLQSIKRDLRSQGYSNVDDANSRLTDLMARQNAFTSSDAFYAQVRRLRDLEDLEAQIKRFTDAGKLAQQQSDNVKAESKSDKKSSTGGAPVPTGARR